MLINCQRAISKISVVAQWPLGACSAPGVGPRRGQSPRVNYYCLKLFQSVFNLTFIEEGTVKLQYNDLHFKDFSDITPIFGGPIIPKFWSQGKAKKVRRKLRTWKYRIPVFAWTCWGRFCCLFCIAFKWIFTRQIVLFLFNSLFLRFFFFDRCSRTSPSSSKNGYQSHIAGLTRSYKLCHTSYQS